MILRGRVYGVSPLVKHDAKFGLLTFLLLLTGNLADLLGAANMPMARDICLIFCSSEKRLTTQPFSLIGAELDFEACSKFSLSHFFMTEAFVFLAQILQGINLHTCVDLIKMELVFVEALVDRSLNQQATEYCKNIVLVIKEYGVQLSFDLYAQLFHLSIACATSNVAVYQEDWLQWLWNIFTSYKEARAGRKRSDSQAVRPRSLSTVSEKPPSVKHHSPVIPPVRYSLFSTATVTSPNELEMVCTSSGALSHCQ